MQGSCWLLLTHPGRPCRGLRSRLVGGHVWTSFLPPTLPICCGTLFEFWKLGHFGTRLFWYLFGCFFGSTQRAKGVSKRMVFKMASFESWKTRHFGTRFFGYPFGFLQMFFTATWSRNNNPFSQPKGHPPKGHPEDMIIQVKHLNSSKVKFKYQSQSSEILWSSRNVEGAFLRFEGALCPFGGCLLGPSKPLLTMRTWKHLENSIFVPVPAWRHLQFFGKFECRLFGRGSRNSWAVLQDVLGKKTQLANYFENPLSWNPPFAIPAFFPPPGPYEFLKE